MARNPFPKFLLLALLGLLLFTACKKDDPTDPDDNPDLPETSITFTAIDDSVKLSDVLIGITPNQGDRDAGVFLRSGTTDGNGRIKFSQLAAQIYYYSATWAASGGAVKRTGTIELEYNERHRQEVNF